MQVTIVFAVKDKDGNPMTKTWMNVAKVGLSQLGTYQLINKDDLDIASIPMNMVVYLESPEHDTQISLIR